jgi:anaerobic magnesium-protoporphyrin IX monomethyl ester cyclase
VTRKILFVTPPYHCGVVEVAGTWPPLGLVYLGSQAKLAGWDVEIYDAMSLRDDHAKIEKRLRSTEFDVIATTAITPTFPDGNELLATAKRVRPDCVTLIGGVHPTFMAAEVLQAPDSAVDYIIAGEGEGPIRRFCEDFDDIEARHRVPNLCFVEDGRVRANPRLPLVPDLDLLELDHSLLDWSIYKYFVIDDGKLGAVDTSRGCSHECTFCSQQIFWNKSWRARTPESVVADICHMHDEYGVNVVLLTDEYPTLERDRWEEFLDRMIASKRGVYLLMETRVEDIVRDRDILARYREAGIIHVYVGAEATDQETLDRINKKLEVDETKLAIELIREFGMVSETSFVLGFPEETRESIDRTFQLADAFDPDFAHFLAITPWPYAEMYREMKDHIEDYDYRNYNLIEPIIRPTAMSRTEIDLAIIDCYRRFYMPRIMKFRADPDPFRREYLMRSTKLIMKSSFLIKKFARVGLKPAEIMKQVMGGKGMPSGMMDG